MRRSDVYFFGCVAAYIVVGALALFTHFVPIEAVQIAWLALLCAPLVWPRFGRWVGIRPFWGRDA